MDCYHWLIVLIQKAHIPFIVGLYVNMKRDDNKRHVDIGDMGDNFPHVFMRGCRRDE